MDFTGTKRMFGRATGLADRLGVVIVVLATLAIRRYELRRHQFHGVPAGGESPRPLVRSRAGFHADQARRQLRDELTELRPRQSAPRNHRALQIRRVHGKHIFAKSLPTVETAFMGLPLSKGWISQPNPGTSVSLRDGEVPYIR
jgi:hypothetical protein